MPVVLPQTLSVQRLACAFSLLDEATDALSERYAVPLVADFVALLLNLIITAYFFLENLMPSTEGANEDFTFTVIELAYMCTHWTRIVMLVEPAASTSKELERSGELVGYLCTAVPHGSRMYEQVRVGGLGHRSRPHPSLPEFAVTMYRADPRCCSSGGYPRSCGTRVASAAASST